MGRGNHWPGGRLHVTCFRVAHRRCRYKSSRGTALCVHQEKRKLRGGKFGSVGTIFWLRGMQPCKPLPAVSPRAELGTANVPRQRDFDSGLMCFLCVGWVFSTLSTSPSRPRTVVPLAAPQYPTIIFHAEPVPCNSANQFLPLLCLPYQQLDNHLAVSFCACAVQRRCVAWLRTSRLKSCFQHWCRCIFQARRLCWLIFGCILLGLNAHGKTGTVMQGQE